MIGCWLQRTANSKLQPGSGEFIVPESRPGVVLIGNSDSSLKELARQLEAGGFPTTSQKDLSKMVLADASAQIVIFLAHVPMEPRNRMAKALRRLNPSLKIVMLYDNQISGTEIADAVINAHCDFEDLGRMLIYLAGKSLNQQVKRA
jgi:hypothetical protein